MLVELQKTSIKPLSLDKFIKITRIFLRESNLSPDLVTFKPLVLTYRNLILFFKPVNLILKISSTRTCGIKYFDKQLAIMWLSTQPFKFKET